MGVPRKVRQIASSQTAVYALAEDGTVWTLFGDGGDWEQVPALPDAPGCSARHKGDREPCNQQRGHRDQHWNGQRRWT